MYALKKEMAIHSSVLAWRVPRTEEAGKAAICGVTQSQTRLKWRSSSISGEQFFSGYFQDFAFVFPQFDQDVS